MNSKANYITFIPDYIHLQARRSSDITVYLAVRSFAENGRGVCFASQSEIGVRAKVGRETVGKAIKYWKFCGRIRSRGRKIRSIGGKPIEHLIIIDDMPSTEGYGNKSDMPACQKNSVEHVDKVDTESIKGKHKRKQSSSNKKSLKKPKDIPLSIWEKSKDKVKKKFGITKISQVLVEKIAREDFIPSIELLELVKKYDSCGKDDRGTRLRDVYLSRLNQFPSDQISMARECNMLKKTLIR